jgi:hypothetical protein
MDEPFAPLDALTREQLYGAFRKSGRHAKRRSCSSRITFAKLPVSAIGSFCFHRIRGGFAKIALVRGTMGIVFVTVEILAENQIVLEQLARCALHPVLGVFGPLAVASIELRLGERREHAGEQTEDICGIGVVDAIVVAERSAGNVAMRVDRQHVRGAASVTRRGMHAFVG